MKLRGALSETTHDQRYRNDSGRSYRLTKTLDIGPDLPFQSPRRNDAVHIQRSVATDILLLTSCAGDEELNRNAARLANLCQAWV